MSDPKQKLTAEEVRKAGLDDWRQVLGTLQARFDTRDFATGLALVDRIGAAAEEMDHHPDITLTYPMVKVTLSSHDVGGITSRDIELGRQISAFAAEAGVVANTSGLTQVEWGLDTPDDGSEVVEFWAALTGAKVDDGEVSDPTRQAPAIWFQERAPAYERGPDDVEQRWHPDVWVAHDEAQARIDAALAAGGSMVDDSHAPSYWVLADRQGNRACICTPEQRG
ncbi:pterin-4-alpha-carbinolamine dehydratase [Nocardioides gansuensis]|uniref:Putative pterin-4-alpha-carbinolamine dehydratase n=1 Tax=Nocardioides gansuensis TaxID=2138300 RepID=A0A2T8F6Y7_9ACTN|nr:4a-hydroxytetrahydrobiopterin dehydratase [Nocardioides gansuensis]PVG81484.1 pterin-4-alpha-carbinolamine dehydratase [Nocardioides gansuensis]